VRGLRLDGAPLAQTAGARGAASSRTGAGAERKQLADRLAHLSTIVPVLAKELVSTRRLLSVFRAENNWLMEELSGLEASSARSSASALNGPENARYTPGGDTEVHGGSRAHLHHDPVSGDSAPPEHHPVAIVELTADQSARIEALSEDCTIVGVERGLPLVRQAGGEVALLEGNGRLAPVEDGPRSVSDHCGGPGPARRMESSVGHSQDQLNDAS
jgi:hypothetical protein